MSASNLDKGLDEIIASRGISSGGSRNAKRLPGRGFKQVRTTRSAAKAPETAKSDAGSRNNKPKGAPVPQVSSAGLRGLLPNPLATAKRVVVSNLPLDINEQAVKQYFQQSVGKIREVIGSYRGDGSPTGTYTITFDKEGAANKMFEKFHNQPIDGGKAHLAVQILLDPTAAQKNTLSGRIGGPIVAPAAEGAKDGKKRKQRSAKVVAKPLKGAEAKPPKTKQKGSGSKKSSKKPRTAADLDAEMSAYFDNAEKNEISV